MLLNEEQAKEFTPDQLEVINSVYGQKETELRSLANKNADGIFNGAAEKLTSLTGIAKADKEKFSDYFERLSTEYLPESSKGKITAAEQAAKEWKEKFENHKGDETLKSELEKAREELGKIPTLLEAKENEWKNKYTELETEFTTTKLNRALTDSMPKFDDNVNKFEIEAKRKNAIDRIKNEYELSFDENGKLIGTKDYQKTLVSDLLKADEELKELILTDQDEGGGGSGGQKKTTTLSIPENLSKGASQQLITEYIVEVEKIGSLDAKFAERFKELCKENEVL